VFDDRKSRRVGAAVIAFCGLAAAAVLTVDCDRLRPGIDVTLYFAHIGALEEGADVQVAGRRIGAVEAVQLQPPRSVRAADHPLHPDGGVAVRLRIQERYAGWAAPNGEFFIAVKGVLGDSYIEIGPPPDGAAMARELRDGDGLRGVDPPRMDQVLVKSFQNMTEFRRLLDEAAPAARQLLAALDQLDRTLQLSEPQPGAYAAARGAFAELGREWDRLSVGAGAGLAREGLTRADAMRVVRSAFELTGRLRAELGATGAALDRLMADVERVRSDIPDDLLPRLKASLELARAAVGKLERTVAVAQELAARVNSGQGTVGALLNDPEFIDDAKQLGKILKREPWRVLGHPTREAIEKQQ
jgi:MlaD protein